jgi:endonuclease/exonuclease/phosphatase family metal-dependent hydrolase
LVLPSHRKIIVAGAQMDLKILSFNIHKGFNNVGRKDNLNLLKRQLDGDGFDIVCLQEIHGDHKKRGNQLEKLADKVWTEFAYGKNSASTNGHHGNAILSRFPIKNWENLNISGHRIDKRGVLHAELDVKGKNLHVLVTHLGLFQVWRKKQLESVIKRVRSHIADDEPLILCGDFNDWNEYATRVLHDSLGLQEVFEKKTGKHARTFPNWMPFLCLDRIYLRGFKFSSPQTLSSKKWRNLSDHLPISVTITWP